MLDIENMEKFVASMEFRDCWEFFEISKEGFLRSKRTKRFSLPFIRKPKIYIAYCFKYKGKSYQRTIRELVFDAWGISKVWTIKEAEKMRQIVPLIQPPPEVKEKSKPKETKKVYETPKPKPQKEMYDVIYDFGKMSGTSSEFKNLDCPQCDPMTGRWEWNYE